MVVLLKGSVFLHKKPVEVRLVEVRLVEKQSGVVTCVFKYIFF